VRCQRHAPAAFYPRGKTQYPLYRRLDGPQGWSGQVRKIAPSTRIRSPDRPVRSQSLYQLSYPAHEGSKGRMLISPMPIPLTIYTQLLPTVGYQLASRTSFPLPTYTTTPHSLLHRLAHHSFLALTIKTNKPYTTPPSHMFGTLLRPHNP
jgi:hypothetical protein